MKKKIKTKINGKEILKEVEHLNTIMNENKEQNRNNKVKNILAELLNKINIVDFRDYTNMTHDKSRLLKKHYIVSVVELLIKTTKENNFNLCRKDGMIYLFNLEFWENITNEIFKDFLGKVSLKMGVEKFDAKHFNFKDDLYRQFISDAGLEEIKGNSKTTLINLKNGTFEISPKKQFLRGFRQEDFITYQLPFNYDKNASIETFQKYLDTVLPEKELQSILAEYIGYIFIKPSVLKLEKVLLLYGSGANGKSVLFEIISALLGQQNTSNYSLQSLTDDKGYSRAMLTNKLLNYASEINGKLESSMFKQLVSGEPVEARLPYGKPQIISDYAKFIFNTNELPKEVENTNAFFRRFLILPFRKTIPENQQDKGLAKKIISKELSGVFNWALEGLKRLLVNKQFTDSSIARNEVDQFRKESDSVLMFIEEEGFKKSITEFILLKDLYNLYCNYCYENGNRKTAKKTFSKRLINVGFEKERKNEGIVFYITSKNNSITF